MLGRALWRLAAALTIVDFKRSTKPIVGRPIRPMQRRRGGRPHWFQLRQTAPSAAARSDSVRPPRRPQSPGGGQLRRRPARPKRGRSQTFAGVLLRARQIGREARTLRANGRSERPCRPRPIRREFALHSRATHRRAPAQAASCRRGRVNIMSNTYSTVALHARPFSRNKGENPPQLLLGGSLQHLSQMARKSSKKKSGHPPPPAAGRQAVLGRALTAKSLFKSARREAG